MAEGAEAVGKLTEVSRAGVFVQAQEFPRPGAIVVFQFQAPTGGLIDVRGEVRWSTQGLVPGQRPQGFGVLVHEAPLPFREFFLWVQELTDKRDEPADL